MSAVGVTANRVTASIKDSPSVGLTAGRPRVRSLASCSSSVKWGARSRTTAPKDARIPIPRDVRLLDYMMEGVRMAAGSKAGRASWNPQVGPGSSRVGEGGREEMGRMCRGKEPASKTAEEALSQRGQVTSGGWRRPGCEFSPRGSGKGHTLRAPCF